MLTSSLPSKTSDLLDRIKKISEISPDLLVGGSALTLHDGHRASDDLDFVQFGPQLDKPRIGRILTAIQPIRPPRLITNSLAAQITTDEGFDLEDVHQDWDVDGVKLTFFCPWKDEELNVLKAAEPASYGAVRVADPETLFKLKSMVLAERTTSRDLFDIWHFIERRGKSIADVDRLLEAKLPYYGLDARLRLIGGKPFKKGDPGFLHADPSAPKNVAELVVRVNGLIWDHRRKMASRIAALSHSPKGPKLPKDRDDRGR